MNYKRSKYFTTSNNKKIKYLFIKKNSENTVVFFHGFMSDMIGAKPTSIQKFCKKHKLNFFISFLASSVHLEIVPSINLPEDFP